MAVLTSGNRARVAAQYQRDAALGETAFTKAQLTAAVAAVDDWIEATQVAFVAALPLGFRTNSTAAQKSLLLMAVVMRRMGRYRAEED